MYSRQSGGNETIPAKRVSARKEEIVWEKDCLKNYEKAKELGGLKAQMRLAMLTRMAGPKAGKEPDSPENIAKFEAAMNELVKEFKQ